MQEQAQAASSASDAVTDNVSAAASPITEPPVAATEVDAIMDIITGQDILDLNSDQVGYLKALGLDFGWGFTSTMQWVLENIHVATGLGWAGSIIAAAFALRGIMLYPHIMSMRNGAKMNRMQADPRSKDMLALSQAAAKSGDQALIQQASFIRGKLQKEYGVSMWGMGWAFLQFPFTFGLFNLVRQMAALPVPGMESAGFLWFTDLTVRDPYLALPALATAIMIASLSVRFPYQYARVPTYLGSANISIPRLDWSQVHVRDTAEHDEAHDVRHRWYRYARHQLPQRRHQPHGCRLCRRHPLHHAHP